MDEHDSRRTRLDLRGANTTKNYDLLDVDDFVSVEDSDQGGFIVVCWDNDEGGKYVVLRTTDHETAHRACDAIGDALRTWPGWR